MSRSAFAAGFRRVSGALAPAGAYRKRRSRARQFTGLEYLEGRVVPATINASAVISSTPAGSNFNDTITLTNASSSDSGIGTFWFAWVPGEDFLADPPISVSPPAGWTDNITNMGAGDGFAIQFVANSPAADVQPGSSLNFSFTTSDSPSAINGNSVFYPGTPVETAFVYPQGPFSDAGHEFVVTPASATTPTPAPTPTPTPAPTPTPTPAPTPTPTPTPTNAPLVTVIGAQEVKNKKHSANELVVDLSGAVNAAQADNVATYHLTTANGKGSFTAKNSPVLKIRSAVFNPANDTVTLTLAKALASTKPVELTINGTSPSGLQDTSGRLIDGNADGVAGGNAVVEIRRAGVILNPAAPSAARVRHAASPVASHATQHVVVSAAPPAQPVATGTTPDPQPVAMGPTPSPQPEPTPPSPYTFL